MTLVYHVYPKDQWCDPKKGTQPFVAMDDYAALEAELAACKKWSAEAIGYQGRIAALEAKCRELQASLEKYQACRVHDVDEKAWLSKRVTELERCLDGGVDCANERIEQKQRIQALEAALVRVQSALKDASPDLWKDLKRHIDSALTTVETKDV